MVFQNLDQKAYDDVISWGMNNLRVNSTNLNKRFQEMTRGLQSPSDSPQLLVSEAAVGLESKSPGSKGRIGHLCPHPEALHSVRSN